MAKKHHSSTDCMRILLCGARGCCPIVEIHRNADKVVITDDDGGKVKLTKKQWREAITKAKIGK